MIITISSIIMSSLRDSIFHCIFPTTITFTKHQNQFAACIEDCSFENVASGNKIENAEELSFTNFYINREKKE